MFIMNNPCQQEIIVPVSSKETYMVAKLDNIPLSYFGGLPGPRFADYFNGGLLVSVLK